MSSAFGAASRQVREEVLAGAVADVGGELEARVQERVGLRGGPTIQNCRNRIFVYSCTNIYTCTHLVKYLHRCMCVYTYNVYVYLYMYIHMYVYSCMYFSRNYSTF